MKVAVELLVFPPLVLEKFRVWELYALSRGIGLGGAPLDDEVELHENVAVEVELVELDELLEELETEADDELPDMDEVLAIEELVLIAELDDDEDVDEDGPFPLRAK